MGGSIQIPKFLIILIVAIMVGFVWHHSLTSERFAAAESNKSKTIEVEPELDGATVFAQTCAACHGVEGKGNAELKAPSIAGMPSYYSLSQLEKFRAGSRGGDASNPPASQMRAIALTVKQENLEKVAKHIQSMERIPTVNRLGGDWKKGKIEYAERCMECHRFNGSGEIVFGSPPLTNLPDWYLFEQLQHFRDNRRGAAEGDENGQKMLQATDGLSDEALKDIVAYIGELAAKRQPKGSIWY